MAVETGDQVLSEQGCGPDTASEAGPESGTHTGSEPVAGSGAPVVRRWLRVRDETCRFPGCNRSAANTEIDHVIPWAKVHDTHHTNLAHLCKKHHRFKTLTRWNVTQERPGWLNWTSPAGEKYTTSPAIDLAPTRPKPTPDHPPAPAPAPAPDDPPPF